MVGQEKFQGTVVKAYGKFFAVALDDSERILLSTPKGALKRDRRGTDLVAVGDRVTVIDVGDNEGRIEHIAPRKNVLARLARHTRDVEQILVANPDQAVFVFSVRDPEPHPRMLDRFLVLAESRQLPARVVVNKHDLDAPGAQDPFAAHRAIYPFHDISVKSATGLEGLRDALHGQVSVVAGPSGVGKSSLINRLVPDLDQATALISDATGKGKHTTTAAQLFRLDPKSFIADTPGIRALALQGVAPGELPACFPEFRTYLNSCRFSDCTHVHEPGCAIREAVADGLISEVRHASYVSLRQGLDDDQDRL
ncbi:MAG TPA: ribosome small subunit-dependent GTPase A [Thermomicrobiales bacterium]|nr:ribosome small subunit-dependent GTPase A [Thermomicrobiales bacterium]